MVKMAELKNMQLKAKAKQSKKSNKIVNAKDQQSKLGKSSAYGDTDHNAPQNDQTEGVDLSCNTLNIILGPKITLEDDEQFQIVENKALRNFKSIGINPELMYDDEYKNPNVNPSKHSKGFHS